MHCLLALRQNQRLLNIGTIDVNVRVIRCPKFSWLARKNYINPGERKETLRKERKNENISI